MINYIEVGKLVPANKKITKHKCWGVFDTLWDEVQRNYADREDLAGFSKNDWRSAYDRALHFDGLDSFVISTPSLVVLDVIVNNFLLGYCHHEWVKHCNRAGYLMAAPAMFKPNNIPTRVNFKDGKGWQALRGVVRFTPPTMN
ncbi:hypothetical protein [Psychrobacter aquimaris]|uniref:hypothetical protein n=1 Tax=Psychrobacter aquimaris TaxID=292733 RepID=UPI0018DEEF3A|nr:hypothetical protein [Psychrobacter aquimaris]